MRAFIDTSTLIKRYLLEDGSIEFNDFLSDVSTIVVSPVTIYEILAVFQRRFSEKDFLESDYKSKKEQFNKEYLHFDIMNWSEELHMKIIETISIHTIKTLDAIQLSSGILAKPDVFVSSDKMLLKCAKKEHFKLKTF